MKKIQNILLNSFLSISLAISFVACSQKQAESDTEAPFVDSTSSDKTPDATAPETSLLISPTGPVLVKKGQSQQFSTNIQGAIFSVEGGEMNGSISPEGVYTPPTRLPVNPSIIVKATLGEQSASAQVKLHAGDNIGFQADTNQKISDSFLHLAYLNNPLTGSAKNQQLAILENAENIQTFTVWSNYLASTPTALFDKNNNFGNFGTDQKIFPLLSHPSTQAVAHDLQQNLHLITREKNLGVYNLVHYYSEDEATTFVAHPLLLDANADQSHPSIIFDSSDRLHVVYANISYPLTHYSIRYTQSADHGNTWSTPVSLNFPSLAKNTKPSIVTDPSGSIIDICWAQELGSQFDILHKRSTDGGQTFSSSHSITHSWTKNEGECSISHNSNGEVLVLYSGFITSTTAMADLEISLAKSNDGIHFSTQTINTQTTHFQGMPIMAINDLGQIDILWTSDVDGNNMPEAIIHARSVDGGNNFSHDVAAFTASSGNAAIPISMKHDSAGRLHLQYLQGLFYWYEMAE